MLSETVATTRDVGPAIVVRAFSHADVPGVLALMRELARFEGYLDEFVVTQDDLIARGLGDQPQFGVLLAHAADAPADVLGIAVYYLIPFTYDLHPDLVLKELFVAAHSRGRGIAGQLMRQLAGTARAAGCKRVRWLVLKDNATARSFYRSLGAAHDEQWDTWVWQVGTTVD